MPNGTRVTLEPAVIMRVALWLLIVVAGLSFSGCRKQDSGSQSATNASSGNPITAPVDYLGAVAKAKKAADRTVGGVGVNQAIQLFQAQEGRNPASLNELVSKQYLPSIPPPPNGMKYDYNPQTGQFRVVPQ
jgi:hypothetical protein